MSNVDHPAHYGGADNPYEVIKVAEAWGFDQDAYLFQVLKYIGRPGKGNYLEDLKKARWFLDRKIARMEGTQSSTLVEDMKLDVNGVEYRNTRPDGVGTMDHQGLHWVLDNDGSWWVASRNGSSWYKKDQSRVPDSVIVKMGIA